jgi:hypothetical protein
MFTKLMSLMGWVPAHTLESARLDNERTCLQLHVWAEDFKAEHERQYQELAERLAETRQHLFERDQRRHLEKLLLDYVNAMPPRPVILKETK